MNDATKQPYSEPTLVDYGKIEDLTRGSGYDWFDFGNGQISNQGNIFGWGPSDTHGST